MRTRTHVIAALTAAVMLSGCADAGEEEEAPRFPPGRQVAERYAPGLEVDLSEMERQWSGMYIEELREGEGARADSGDVVLVHYTGWLPTGKKFDSSRDRDQPFRTAIGYGQVIEGWDQGIVGMREGGRRRLVIPPLMAYGEEGNGPIPGNSTLVFDVELLEVENRVPEGGPGADTTGSGD